MRCTFPVLNVGIQLVGPVLAQHVSLKKNAHTPLALYFCRAHRCGHKASHTIGFTQWVHTPALGCVPTASLLLQQMVWTFIDTTDAAQPFVEVYKRQVDCRLAHPIQCSFLKGLRVSGLHYSTPRWPQRVQAASTQHQVGTDHLRTLPQKLAVGGFAGQVHKNVVKRTIMVNWHQVSHSHHVLAIGLAYTNGYKAAHGELASV
jgi:hypothetical protein